MAFSSTGTLACALFAAQRFDAQPKVAMPQKRAHSTTRVNRKVPVIKIANPETQQEEM
jgi:hypothetical protein